MLGPAALPEAEAIHLAYARLRSAEGERLAEVAQKDLFSTPAPQGFAAALEACGKARRFRTVAGKCYWWNHARAVRRGLGAYRLESFAPPEGNARLRAYVAELERRGQAGRTIRNRLTIAVEVLHHAVAEGWLRAMPALPDASRLPPKAAPVFLYVTEAQFREWRARLLAGLTVGEAHRIRGVRTADDVRVYVERRRFFVSWCFYTGAHAYDAAHVQGGDLLLDFGAYIRRNHKSARCIEPRRYMMPPPLLEDVRALCEVVGRPPLLDEELGGGPWPNGPKTLNATAAALGFPHGVTAKVLRRSFVREMAIRGVPDQDVADMLGHADTRMIREIYRGCAPQGALTASPWGHTPLGGGRGGLASVTRIGGAR